MMGISMIMTGVHRHVRWNLAMSVVCVMDGYNLGKHQTVPAQLYVVTDTREEFKNAMMEIFSNMMVVLLPVQYNRVTSVVYVTVGTHPGQLK